MRVIVFFDLPMESLSEKKEYRRFRKFLILNGYIQMQKSIYSKLVLNGTRAKLAQKKIRKAAPKKGLIQLLTITEKQFTSIEDITGSYNNEVLNSTKWVTRI